MTQIHTSMYAKDSIVGDLKRECYDEVCSYSEAMEAIENVPSMIAFWDFHNDPCESFGLKAYKYQFSDLGLFMIFQLLTI